MHFLRKPRSILDDVDSSTISISKKMERLLKICLLLLWIEALLTYQSLSPTKAGGGGGEKSSSAIRRTPYCHSSLYFIKPYKENQQSLSQLQSRRNIYRYQRIFHSYSALQATSAAGKKPDVPAVTVSIPMGPGCDPMQYRFRPLFKNSTFIVVTFSIPFDLSLEKPPKGFPAPIVTKDNPQGEETRELQGDVLRATTSWSQSYLTGPGGWASDIINVAGNVKWKRAIFDTLSAPWEEVIRALQSNVERSDEVTMVFERALEEESEPEEGVQ